MHTRRGEMPPGHHALPDMGVGYCIFGNVAIAAKYARRRYGLERILIVDWDVHAGNGTQTYACPIQTVLAALNCTLA